MFALLSTSDTDLRSARAATNAGAPVGWRQANPNRVPLDDLDAFVEGTDLVVVRLLGGLRAWEDGLDKLLAGPRPVVVLTGEQAPDAELMSASTVPAGVAAQAHAYLAHGGTENLTQLASFLSDTVLFTGHGFEQPKAAPSWGPLEESWPLARPEGDDRPCVAILYYRAHQMSGNQAAFADLARAVEAAGSRALPLYVASLRAPEADLLATLAQADAVITTVLAAGGTVPANAQAGGDDDAWDAGALADLDIPVIQAFATTTSHEAWLANDDGLTPLDAATQVAVPEFDGRLISAPFSFKEIDDDGLPVYVADPERCRRVAGIAHAHARLRHVPPAERRLAIVLSAYPTKHARIGNAVGLDTPASVLRLLHALHDAGVDVGPMTGQGSLPGLESDHSDDLIKAIIARGGYDQAWLTEQEMANNPLRIKGSDYQRWFSELDDELRAGMVEAWGEAPGELFLDQASVTRKDPGDLVYAGLTAGNIVVLVQPPRGFGENPIAIYHDPSLAPSHHYMAAYRWLEAGQDDGGFGAHAIIHVGKHGNLEWLPGKGAALGPGCAPDATLGNLPMLYPFLVNDPGEGTQAKRRAHATLIDHLVPPMTRADSYGEIAKLEQLLDEYATVRAMDPAKAPAVRQQIWTLIQAAKLDHDLGVAQGVELDDQDAFDDFVMHVDGWLCEIKDVQIRGGLHILGQAPTGEARVSLVLAMLQATQIWGGDRALPGLRTALGLDEGNRERVSTDEIEAVARELVQGMEDRDWRAAAIDEVVAQMPPREGADPEAVRVVLRFAVDEVVPRLDGTTDELDHVLHALDGGFVPSGPSGSPLRGLVNVLPTGRNFYSVDPRAIPSRLAWETGQNLAESLLARYKADKGEYPASVGLSLWGTSAMRTAGDDIAEALALMGVEPVWDDASRRITGLEVTPLDQLGRPRVDVTLRISGFFRDAFPHAVALLDDAVGLVAGLDESHEDNFLLAHVAADLAEGTGHREATTRIFGSRPGSYGAGLLQLIDSRDWRTDADLAEVYETWGGYAYGRDMPGIPAREQMRTAYRRIRVAAKNVDTREHDVLDSDDYFQFHGGMVAHVRSLTGENPEAYIGDSTRPEHVATRTLLEETSRVFRARVVNPKWMDAMRQHGYKGAFEMAATVDYLFGYDATTNVVDDWMYERLTNEYVLDEKNREFLQESNPWALHAMGERLLEAVERGMWANPDPQVLADLKQAYLDAEGDLEGDDE